MKKILSVSLVLCLIISLTACGSTGGSSASQPGSSAASQPGSSAVSQPESPSLASSDGLKVALSNSMLSNQWRIQMIKVFEAYCRQLKEQSVISEYFVTSSGNDAQAQINEIRNLIAQEYDIIVADCASSALAPVLEEAAEQGIIVVTFDNIVETENTYSIAVDGTAFGTNQATFMCEQLGGEGNILIIRGMAGVHDDTIRHEAYLKVLEQYPNIKVVGEGYGNWDFGSTAQLINDLLTANEGTKIDGILQQGMGEVAIVDALIKHGYDPAEVVLTGEWTNGHLRVVKEYGINSYITGVPAYLSAMSVDIALAVLNGEEVEQHQLIPPPFVPSDEVEKWYAADQGDGFMPVFTDEANTWNITIEDMLT